MKRNPLFDIPLYLGQFKFYLGIRIYIFYLIVLLVVLFDSLGISLLIPTLQAFLVDGDFSNSEFVGKVSDFFDLQSVSTSSVFLVTAFLFLIKGIFAVIASAYNANLRARLLSVLKFGLYESFKATNLNYFKSHDAGHFINIMGDQISKALIAFHFLGVFLSQLFSAILYITISFYFSGWYSLFIVAIGIFIIWIFKWLNAYVRRISRLAASESGNFSHLFLQSVETFFYLKSTNGFDFIDAKLKTSVNALSAFERRLGFSYAFSNSVKEPTIIIVLLVAAYYSQFVNGISSERLFITFGLLYRSTNALFTMQSSWQKTLESIGSMELVHAEHLDQVRATDLSKVELKDCANIRSVELVDVQYRYADDQDVKPTLEKVSLKLDRPGLFAIKGASGSGKTTLVRLLTGMLAPDSGQILVNGVGLEKFSIASYRNRLGLLVQDPPSYSGTLFDNVVMGRAKRMNQVAVEAVGISLKSAAIEPQSLSEHDWMDSPMSYGSLGGFSGGQRQRIALAREIYKDADFLILDEPSSALDVDTEALVISNLKILSKTKIIVIITHSGKLLSNCDQVFNLTSGKLGKV